MDIAGRSQGRLGNSRDRAECDEGYVVDYPVRPARSAGVGNGEADPAATAMTALATARIAVLAASLGGLVPAATWSVRLGWADYWFRKETAAATEKAIALTPGQSAYRVRLALLTGDEDPARALLELRRAVALNPSDGRAWIELGLRLEAAGDLPLAEQTLLRAAEADRTYLPRWTLMNYYFRRNDIDRFWFWAKAAVPMIYADPLPLFHLCGRMNEDGALIARLDIRQPQVQAGYLFYLLDMGRADLAGPSSRALLAGNRDSDVPLLLAACDRLIEAGRVDEAMAIWEELSRSRRLPFRLAGERKLTNGGFEVSPTGHGFDWRLPAQEGISVAREEDPVGLRLTFSGMQAEKAEPLIQFIPVRESTAYELKFAYYTSGIEDRSGLSWQIACAGREVNLEDGNDLAANQRAERRLAFVTPAGCRMVRLSLVYQRRPGTTRIAGYLVLRNVELNRSRQVSLEAGNHRSRTLRPGLARASR
jgi:tetratricopeptide (TPR) repeat protein